MSNNVSRRQAGRWSQQPQEEEVQYGQAPAAPVAAPGVDLVGELTKLGELKASGVLSEAEFEVAKAKLLNA